MHQIENEIVMTGDIDFKDYEIKCEVVNNNNSPKTFINFKIKECVKQEYNSKKRYKWLQYNYSKLNEKYENLLTENEKIKKDLRIFLLEKELSELKNMIND